MSAILSTVRTVRTVRTHPLHCLEDVVYPHQVLVPVLVPREQLYGLTVGL
jgi:hypothetical protein